MNYLALNATKRINYIKLEMLNHSSMLHGRIYNYFGEEIYTQLSNCKFLAVNVK